ncbi:MAG: hypothetical protein ACLGI9_18515, partial [Thermoanaerobaculia bacterium]
MPRLFSKLAAGFAAPARGAGPWLWPAEGTRMTVIRKRRGRKRLRGEREVGRYQRGPGILLIGAL